MKEDLWKEFASEVKKGWKVNDFKAMDRCGVESKGTVVSVKRRAEKCPHCQGELDWHYDVALMWEPFDPTDSGRKPFAGSKYFGWTNGIRRGGGARWVVGDSTSLTTFDPPD